jgi:hypothetical protein
MNKQNKLFRRVWNINFASAIVRDSYVANGLVWRYCHDVVDGPVVYFSVEQ